ncbi:MAG TPA: TrkA family potassium uptake protein [Candidatus Cloacimonadota bacterium]|nr:TrkA family potassium uptake protein [Candidatus Cloacimonadota bacterium]
MKKFAVIGLGRFGWTVATTLAASGVDVVAVDKNPKLVDDIKDKVALAVCLDSTEEDALRGIEIQDMDAVVLAIGTDIQESILTCAILKKIGVNVIYAKVENHLHAKILDFMGVKNIYFPEELIGEQLAKSLISKNILEYINLTSGHIMIELIAPPQFVGKTLQELALPTERGINVVAIKYNNLNITEDGDKTVEVKINDLPGANDVVRQGDILILLGPKGSIDKLIKDTSSETD